MVSHLFERLIGINFAVSYVCWHCLSWIFFARLLEYYLDLGIPFISSIYVQPLLVFSTLKIHLIGLQEEGL